VGKWRDVSVLDERIEVHPASGVNHFPTDESVVAIERSKDDIPLRVRTYCLDKRVFGH